jgi:D-Tyr-tRNAtyr deacylase
MKLILQKVKSIKYTNVSIGEGIVIFLGVEVEDKTETIDWMADKILKIRLYDDWKLTIPQKGLEIAIVPEQNVIMNRLSEPSILVNKEKVDLYCRQFYETLCTKYSPEFVRFITCNNTLEITNNGPFTITLSR